MTTTTTRYLILQRRCRYLITVIDRTDAWRRRQEAARGVVRLDLFASHGGRHATATL